MGRREELIGEKQSVTIDIDGSNMNTGEGCILYDYNSIANKFICEKIILVSLTLKPQCLNKKMIANKMVEQNRIETGCKIIKHTQKKQVQKGSKQLNISNNIKE